MTADDTHTHEWMTPGTTVIIDYGSEGGLGQRTITQVTPTQIVLDDNTRFYRYTLGAISRIDWAPPAVILNPEDPRTEITWLRHRQNTLRATLHREIDRRLSDFTKGGDLTRARSARALIGAAITQYQTWEEKILQLTNPAPSVDTPTPEHEAEKVVDLMKNLRASLDEAKREREAEEQGENTRQENDLIG